MIRALALLMTTAVLAESGFDARMKAGLKALEAGDLVRAEIELGKAVRLSPENADARAVHALALDLAGSRPRAVAEYKAALRLDRRYVEGRVAAEAARARGWTRRVDERLVQQQRNLSLEALNAPQPMQKEPIAPKIAFPPYWRVDGLTARPNEIGSRASLWVAGGPNEFNAYDGEMWLEAARQAEPERYEGYKPLGVKTFARKGAKGAKAKYLRRAPRYREPFVVLDVVLIKDRQYLRAVYEAPQSQFQAHLPAAEKALDSLEFK